MLGAATTAVAASASIRRSPTSGCATCGTNRCPIMPMRDCNS